MAACVSFERAALNELVAQLVEQRPFKAWVLGSNPSELTTHRPQPTDYRQSSTRCNGVPPNAESFPHTGGKSPTSLTGSAFNLGRSSEIVLVQAFSPRD
jgi:hypothetical protein